MKNMTASIVLVLTVAGLAIAADTSVDYNTPQGKAVSGTASGVIDRNTAPLIAPSPAQTPAGSMQGVNPGRSDSAGTPTTGTVESIDRSGNRVRIRDAQGRINEYHIRDNTRFMRGEKKGRFSDVKVGDSVEFESTSDMGIKKFTTTTTPKTSK